MKRDYKQFPGNDNGDVLWGLRTSGDALTDPRLIDFSVIFRSTKEATEFAGAFGGKYRPDVERLTKNDQEDGFAWHVLVYLHEVPTCRRITAFERALRQQAAILGGRFWGWSATFVPSKDPAIVKEQRWVYVARDPNDGLLASMRLNLGLIVHAPMRALPILLISSVSYETDSRNAINAKQKLPTNTDRALLQRVGGKRVALVTSRAAAIHAGACLHANWRMDYFYVADPRGLKSALQKFHRKECPGRRTFFQTQRDPRWKCYLEWLYPNESTIKHYRPELEELGAI
jgi:hypothetical protein